MITAFIIGTLPVCFPWEGETLLDCGSLNYEMDSFQEQDYTLKCNVARPQPVHNTGYKSKNIPMEHVKDFMRLF